MKRWKTGIARWIVFSSLLVTVALFVGCDKDDDDENPQPTYSKTADYTDAAAVQWMQLSRDMVKAGAFSPPRAARAYGYLGMAIYEGVVNGMPEHISLYGQINGMPAIPATNAGLEYHWPSVANKASADILAYLFTGADPAVLALATALETQLHDEYAATLPADVLERSETYGQLVATVISSCAEADGYATNHNCAYTPPVGEGLWVPTPPGNVANPLEPCWGENRAFVMDDLGTQCTSGTPPAYSTEVGSGFYTEMLEVYNTVNANVAEERAIASFWADGGGTSTPPGHWVNITTSILNSQDANLAVAAEIYCKLGIAVNDAFICCWKTKYQYNYLRPITAIRALIPGAEGWLSPIGTPPFPEYTSGHSTQSGAAYVVLTDFFGAIAFTDTTNSAAFPARSFDNFEAAATEAALSRLYGGIHFRSACEIGVTQGECIGALVNALQFRANS